MGIYFQVPRNSLSGGGIIMSDKMKEMLPVSREEVEVDGVYRDELGREEYLQKGEEFPSDPVYGTMEWELSELSQETNSKGHTDDRLIPKKK
jgi:hypothetical protein